MKTKLDLNNWNRADHFEFYSKMEEPFYGLTFTINCTQAYIQAKVLNIPFYTYYLHKILVAINSVENLKYRIIENQVYCYDRVDASATILREDKTFGFSLIEFSEDINQFDKNVIAETTRVQNTTGLFTREFPESNLIHFSALPLINFTSLSHARSYTFLDSCPKISVGKLTEINSQKSIPVSIHVHHALVDGYHIGLFIDSFEKQMNL